MHAEEEMKYNNIEKDFKFMKFISYAQELEDLILYDFFKNVKNGFYIDVGANDPWNLSVTKSLYENGFHGINIEPLDNEYKELVIDRPRDINLRIGLGDIEGELELYNMGSGSTFSQDVINATNKIDNQISRITVPITTLSNICEKYCNSQEIHFCKIDVEGFEKKVLLGADLKRYRPLVFVMESAEPGTSKPCYDKWEYILIDNGYELAYSYGINRYYVDISRKSEGKFIGVDELLKKYEVYHIVHNSQYISKQSGIVEIIKQIAAYAMLIPAIIYNNINCYNSALGDHSGFTRINVSEGKSNASSSILKPKEHLNVHPDVFFNKEIEVPIITLDKWAEENSIEKVDFLWFDLQGFEYQVLNASPKILSTVKTIYTEVSFINAYENTLLYPEFKKWLENEGFYENILDSQNSDMGNALFVRNNK